MSIPTARKCSYTLEPLVADQIGDHPLALREIGVAMAAIGAIGTVLGLDVTGAHSCSRSCQVDHFGIPHLLGKLRKHARRT